MKLNQKRFEATMVFDDDSIRRMFRMESRIYERMQRLTHLAVSLALILMALFAKLPVPATALCLMAGSFLLFARDFHCDMQAERVLQARRGEPGTVRCVIGGSRVSVGEGISYPVGEIERLVKDKEYYYLFWNRQTAVMLPRDGLKPGQPESFERFLSEAAGRQWQQPRSLLWLNGKELLQIIQDKASPWLGR